MIETLFINQININKVKPIVIDFGALTVIACGMAAMMCEEDSFYVSSKTR
jgi:hypothetical protein